MRGPVLRLSDDPGGSLTTSQARPADTASRPTGGLAGFVLRPVTASDVYVADRPSIADSARTTRSAWP